MTTLVSAPTRPVRETRLADRPLVPTVETEWLIEPPSGAGPGELVLIGNDPVRLYGAQSPPIDVLPQADRSVVTVLVGDVREYAILVRTVLSEDLQRSVSRAFEALAGIVTVHGGAVKAYQRDAILAFWEGDVGGKHALAACKAALAMDELSTRLAADRSVWSLGHVPLKIGFALATGLVMIDSFGRGGTAGLSTMGEPVGRAFRMEELANDETGHILACSTTRAMAERAFAFRDLGHVTAKGFDRPDRVFALVGERGGAAVPR